MSLWSQFTAYFRKEKLDAEMSEEMRAHLELQTAENIARGMSPDNARYAALRRFGGVEQLKERARDQRGGRWLEQLAQDVRHGLRTLRKNPGFTTTAVLTLAIGVGANTAIFSVVSGVLLRPLPYREPDQLVQLWEAPALAQQSNVSAGVFLDWQRQSRSFDDISVVSPTTLHFSSAGERERLGGMKMSAHGLRLLGARPLLGRLFAADEDQLGQEKVIVLSHSLWQRRFAGSHAIVGETVQVDDDVYTVVGVLPADFPAWHTRDFVIPFAFEPEERENRRTNFLQVVGRLKHGVTLAQASAELNAIAARSQALYPQQKRGWGAMIVPLHDQLTQAARSPVWLLFGAVGCLLLIACVNVANLLLARASVRRHELALRAALGATRGRILRQLLAESFLLALLGAGLGVALAAVMIDGLVHLPALRLPRVNDIRLDLRVLAFAGGVSLVTGLLFGLLPAWQATRASLTPALARFGIEMTIGEKGRLRQGLVVLEIALALVLLTGAGLLFHSFIRLVNVPLGFTPAGAWHVQVSLPEAKYEEPARRNAFLAAALAQVEALPGVEAAGFGHALPTLLRPSSTYFTIVGQPAESERGHPVDFDFCTPGYFSAMGIAVRLGRGFDVRDYSPEAPRTAIVNEAVVRAHFPTTDPLGHRLRIGTQDWEIVGVVADVRHRGLTEPARPTLYRSPASTTWDLEHLVVRSTLPQPVLARDVQRVLRELEPQAVLAGVTTLEAVLANSLAPRRSILLLLGLFAGVALVLAGVGLYGVIAYTVAQRTREIGIRLALGARPPDIFTLVVGDGVRLVAIGMFVGLAASLGLTRLLTQQLYGTTPTDPLTFLAVSCLLAVVTLAACWLPARRATKVDPMLVLRTE